MIPNYEASLSLSHLRERRYGQSENRLPSPITAVGNNSVGAVRVSRRSGAELGLSCLQERASIRFFPECLDVTKMSR